MSRIETIGDATLYLVMRNDLPSLNPGKLAAQAAHCANAFVASPKWRNSPLLRQWQQQTTQKFGTTIVLGAPFDFIMGMEPETQVWDPTYPWEIPYEVWCAMRGDERVILSGNRAIFLRRELVGAFAFGTSKPDALNTLELYP